MAFSALNFQTTIKTVNALKDQAWLEDNLPERAIVHDKAALYLKDAPYVVMYAGVPVLSDLVPLRGKGQIFTLCGIAYYVNVSDTSISKNEILECPSAEETLNKTLDFKGTLYIFSSKLRKNYTHKEFYNKPFKMF